MDGSGTSGLEFFEAEPQNLSAGIQIHQLTKKFKSDKTGKVSN